MYILASICTCTLYLRSMAIKFLYGVPLGGDEGHLPCPLVVDIEDE